MIFVLAQLIGIVIVMVALGALREHCRKKPCRHRPIGRYRIPNGLPRVHRDHIPVVEVPVPVLRPDTEAVDAADVPPIADALCEE